MFILSLDIVNYRVYEWFLVMLLLVPQAIYDIKKQMVWISPDIAILIFVQIFGIDGGIISHLIRLIPGAIFIIFSFVSKESIGMGDGIVILALGTLLGMEKTFKLLFFASCFASLFSVVLILLKKADRKSRIPFIPFILMGTIAGGII